MKKANTPLLLILFLCLGYCSCQKVITADIEDEKESEKGIEVRFNVVQMEQIPFNSGQASRSTEVKSICSMINLAIYQAGTKIKQVNQTKSDSDFGSLKVVLPKGDFKIVILAHSGQNNPTMTDARKITFDGKLTDTFYYSQDVTVSENASYDLTLKRAVAAFRFMALDTIPTTVSLMRFYYTGGSSTFDAVNGVGCVDSRQTESINITTDMQNKPGTFEVYTFPRSDSNVLQMQVTAYGPNINIIKQIEFADVPITRNQITVYSGSFFGGKVPGDTTETTETTHLFSLYTNDEWAILNKSY